MKSLHIRGLYWLVAAVHVLALLLHQLNVAAAQSIVYFTKPLLMVVLLWYYIAASNQAGRAYMPLLALGIAFSWLGDVTLMVGGMKGFEGKAELWFLAGLVSFLITHVCYILIFLKDARSHENISLLKQRPLLAFPAVLLYLGLMVLIVPGLAFEMMFPVMLYGAVITIMVITALNRAGKVPPASYSLVMAGAVLFFISDSIIAINRFFMPIAIAPLLIMCTYIVAQYFIVQGILRRVD